MILGMEGTGAQLRGAHLHRQHAQPAGGALQSWTYDTLNITQCFVNCRGNASCMVNVKMPSRCRQPGARHADLGSRAPGVAVAATGIHLHEPQQRDAERVEGYDQGPDLELHTPGAAQSPGISYHGECSFQAHKAVICADYHSCTL